MDLMAVIEAIPGIGPAIPHIMTVIAAVIAIASVLAPLIPPTSPFYRIINILASNVGQARNANDPLRKKQ